MAYSNWGAVVYENSKRRQDKEDVGVFDTAESELPSSSRVWANIRKTHTMFPDGDAPAYLHSRHAVLGDDVVRLCAYKNYPELWVCRDGVPEKVAISEEFHDDIEDYGIVEVDEFKWRYSFKMYAGNMIDLELIEPNGTVWTATSGSQYGAGYME